MRSYARHPKKTIQDEQVLSSEMMGEIRNVSKKDCRQVDPPHTNIVRDMKMIASKHSSQNETKRTARLRRSSISLFGSERIFFPWLLRTSS